MSNKSVQVILGEVAAATQTAILPTVIANLQATTGTTTAVNTINYQYGHEAELSAKIVRFQNDPDFNTKDYPLIWVREDISYYKPANSDFRIAVIPSIIIAFGTQGGYLSADREVQTFNPVLRPIYIEFLRQVSKRKREFRIYDPYELYQAKTWERKLWGTPEDSKAAGVFNGHVDAIEIVGLELTLNNNCLTDITN